jgi:hypothetical protein
VDGMKPFSEMSTDEARIIAREAVRQSFVSEAEIRRNLTKAGFRGDVASFFSLRFGYFFKIVVMVWGPKGELIAVY